MKIKIHKKEKVIWKLNKTAVERKQKQPEMNIELGTRKNFQKVKEMPPKWKQPAKYGKTMKRYKKFILPKKCFPSIEKKAGIFVNEASEKRGKSAKLKKRQQFKQIQKLKIA